MKMLLIAKTSVFIMTGLIVAGLALIVFKITENHSKHKLQNPNTTFYLEPSEKIIHFSGCGAFACLLTQTDTNKIRLLLFNPETAHLHHQVLLKTE